MKMSKSGTESEQRRLFIIENERFFSLSHKGTGKFSGRVVDDDPAFLILFANRKPQELKRSESSFRKFSNDIRCSRKNAGNLQI